MDVIHQINHRVWRIQKNQCQFSLKYYQNQTTLLKVKAIHKRLTQLRFPYTLDLEHHPHTSVLCQKWISHAEELDFSKEKDRSDSIKILHDLHITHKIVDWDTIPYLQRGLLLQKWKQRLNKFHQRKDLLIPYIGNMYFQQIMEIALKSIHLIELQPVHFEIATLLHGDVAHHNFLRRSDGQLRLIDFDLANYGPSSHEKILWMHRVLPYMDFDIQRLIQEQPLLKTVPKQQFVYLLFPNEVMREWLHFLTLDTREQTQWHKKLHDFTNSFLSHWETLCYNIKQINF